MKRRRARVQEASMHKRWRTLALLGAVSLVALAWTRGEWASEPSRTAVPARRATGSPTPPPALKQEPAAGVGSSDDADTQRMVVLGRDEKPVATARVRFFRNGTITPWIDVDEGGGFTLSIADWRTRTHGLLDRIHVQAPGYATAALDRFEPSVTLRPEHIVSGVVVNRNGERLANFPLVVAPGLVTMGESRGPDQVLRTDATGSFTCRALPYGRVHIRSRDKVRHYGTVETVAGDKAVRLVVWKSTFVVGTVLDHTGAPVLRASVFDAAQRVPHTDGRFRAPLATTDERGAFSIESETSTAITLLSVANGKRSQTVRVERAPEKTTTNVTLRLEATPSLHSYVRVRTVDEEGAAVPNVGITWRLPAWRPNATRLGGDGAALIPPTHRSDRFDILPREFVNADEVGVYHARLPVAPGTIVVLSTAAVVREGRAVHPRCTLRLTTTHTPEVDPTMWALRRARRCFLRAVHEDGRPATELLVVWGPAYNLKLDRSANVLRFEIDPEGSFQLLYESGVSRENIVVVDADWRPPAEGAIADVVVLPPAPTDAALVTALAARFGTVVDDRGQPIGGAVVESDLSMALTGPNGAFQLQSNSAHPLAIAAIGYGRVFVRDTKKPIVLQRPGKLEIVIAPPAPWRDSDWQFDITHPSGVRHRYAIRSDGARRFEFYDPDKLENVFLDAQPTMPISQNTLEPGARHVLDDVGPGTYQLRLWTDRYAIKKTVRVRPHHTTRAEFLPR